MSFDSQSYNTTHNNKPEINQDNNTTHAEPIYYEDNKKGKKKQRLPEVDPNAPCFIQQLSVELVTHIFARLDPVSLATVAKVCTYWRHIVNDDSCWRDAFVSFFGCLPLKRLSLESWKTEYTLRTHLVRKWAKGRGTVMSFIPKIGSIQSMYTDFEDNSLIVASLEHGVGVKCNPKTGKVDRHLIYSTNDSIRSPVTATVVDKDRILWGFGQGFITLSVRTKTTGNTANRLKVFSDFHQAPVRVLALPRHLQEVVLSGADDGQVKIWDIMTTSCAWTLYPVSALARQPTCIQVTLDQRVIIGYDDGSIAVWKINMNTVTALHRNNHSNDFTEKREKLREELEEMRIDIASPSTSARHSVKTMLYDEETKALIVAYDQQTDVHKYSSETGELVAVFGYGHTGGTSITCMAWDRSSVSSTLSLESAFKPRTTTQGRKKGGIIDLSSNSSSNGTSGQVTPSASTLSSIAKTTRVLVTGDDVGTICLWNGDAVNQEDRSVKPIRTLFGHIVGISCIYIDACKLVTGSDDGWIRMWDPLTGNNINTLGNLIPKNAPVDRTDINVMRVKHIWCNDYQGVATIGHQVKTWDFSPGKQFLTRSLKGKGKPCNNSARDRVKYEINREVKESIEKLKFEKDERELNQREINKLSLGGLTDEEMLDYAMMLSEQEHGVTTAVEDRLNNDFVDEDDEELMRAVIASLDLVEENHSADQIDQEDTSELSSHEDWPTVAESHGNATQPLTEEEQLLYILELSKTEQ